MNMDEKQFGLENLRSIAEENYGVSPAKLLSCIFAAVCCFSSGHEQQDDMAAVAFQSEKKRS
jgi:serine phosphatase RsbU (regulator of sigma subunit)